MTFTPPRPELIALLDAVKDHPDEDTPRLVLADWLDEQGTELDAERAKFIRDDIAFTRGAKRPRSTPARNAEAVAVIRRMLGPLPDLAYHWWFKRGLPDLTVNGPRFLSPAVRPLFATEAFAFVPFVALEEAGGARLEAMAALPEFRFVAGVGVNPFTAPGALSAARFFGSPNLTGLRHIAFRGINPGAAGARVLASNPALSRLRKLSLHHNRLVDAAAAALAGSPHLTNLTYLNLSDNNIGDKGAEALAASKFLANLLELDLTMNPRLTDAGKQFLRAAFGARVKIS